VIEVKRILLLCHRQKYRDRVADRRPSARGINANVDQFVASGKTDVHGKLIRCHIFFFIPYIAFPPPLPRSLLLQSGPYPNRALRERDHFFFHLHLQVGTSIVRLLNKRRNYAALA